MSSRKDQAEILDFMSSHAMDQLPCAGFEFSRGLSESQVLVDLAQDLKGGQSIELGV